MCPNCVALRAKIHEMQLEMGQRVADGDLSVIAQRFGLRGAQGKLLLMLARAKGRPVRTSLLINTICGREANGAENIKVYVSKVRKVIGHEAIETMNGRGYQLSKTFQAVMEEVLPPVVGPPPEPARRFMPANDDADPMAIALAMTVGRLAYMHGIDKARETVANVMVALDRQYGPAT